jgi:hypothetical protein
MPARPSAGRGWASRLLTTAFYLLAVSGLGAVALTGPETASVEPLSQAIASGSDGLAVEPAAWVALATVALD